MVAHVRIVCGRLRQILSTTSRLPAWYPHRTEGFVCNLDWYRRPPRNGDTFLFRASPRLLRSVSLQLVWILGFDFVDDFVDWFSQKLQVIDADVSWSLLILVCLSFCSHFVCLFWIVLSTLASGWLSIQCSFVFELMSWFRCPSRNSRFSHILSFQQRFSFKKILFLAHLTPSDDQLKSVSFWC